RDIDNNWYLLSKADQWVDVAYNAANFTASAGNWTVDSADVETLCYHIDGNKMTVAYSIQNTDVSAAPVSLRIVIPDGRVAARTIRAAIAVIVDAGVNVNTGFARVVAGGTVIELFKDVAATAWTTTAGDNTL